MPMTVKKIKKQMIEIIKAMNLPVSFLVDEADADYGYRLDKNLKIMPIGEYSDPYATKLEDLSILDLANFIFANSDECKEWREKHDI